MPAKGSNFPVVLVIQEIFGVHEHIKDMCRRFAKASGKANTARLGIIGYCWGGRTMWLYSAHNPKIKPQDPIDIGDSLTVPVLGMYAGLDTYIKEDVVSGSEVIIFPDVRQDCGGVCVEARAGLVEGAGSLMRSSSGRRFRGNF